MAIVDTVVNSNGAKRDMQKCIKKVVTCRSAKQKTLNIEVWDLTGTALKYKRTRCVQGLKMIKLIWL